MLVSILFLTVLLILAILSANIENIFSSDELTEMGIRLDSREADEMYCISKQVLVKRNL